MSMIRTVIEGDLVEIVFSAPERMNAFCDEDWFELVKALEGAEAGPARCVLLRGEGGVFSAGHNLSGLEPPHSDARRIVGEIVNPALRKLRETSIPTIALVQGICLGGGLCVAAACDVIFCSESAKLGVPYRNVGFVADGGLHVFLRDAIGHHRASHLIYGGGVISGAEAFAIGLCSQVCSDGQVREAALEFARHVAKGPTEAFRESKAILLSEADFAGSLKLEAEAQARIFQTADAAEGVAAFKEKRPARFIGR